MAYKVVDNEFNRVNYKDIIGKIYNSPPSYAAVVEIEEVKCGEVFEKVAALYNNAHVLVKVWPDIQQERRQESIDKIRSRVADMNDAKMIRSKEANDVFNMLDNLEKFNKGDQKLLESYSLEAVVEGPIINMAVHSIADCECTPKIPTQKNLMQTPLVFEMLETSQKSLAELRKDVGGVRYGKPGEILINFRGETYSSPEPKDVLPVGESEESKKWALRQILDGSAKEI